MFDLDDHHDDAAPRAATSRQAGAGCATAPESERPTHEQEAAAVRWLHAEFPGWAVTLDRTAGWEGDLRPLWIASREGHHPQAELSAAKLHSRLTDYLEREARRGAYRN